MKAAVVEGPGPIARRDLPGPGIEQPGHAVVRLRDAVPVAG
ncbi:hypothetical protein [Streptomyces sp. NPDC002825]